MRQIPSIAELSFKKMGSSVQLRTVGQEAIHVAPVLINTDRTAAEFCGCQSCCSDPREGVQHGLSAEAEQLDQAPWYLDGEDGWVQLIGRISNVPDCLGVLSPFFFGEHALCALLTRYFQGHAGAYHDTVPGPSAARPAGTTVCAHRLQHLPP
jgi:hypothetical protein